MRKNWLTRLERQYVHTLLDEAIQHVKMRDMKSCVAFVQHAIKSHRVSTSILSPQVMDKFAKDGYLLLQRMLNRHVAYKSLPPPLRGDALHSKASTVGLLQRTMTVRVNATTLREECNQAEGLRKMKMPEK
jgi:hypothetical protein